MAHNPQDQAHPNTKYPSQPPQGYGLPPVPPGYPQGYPPEDLAYGPPDPGYAPSGPGYGPPGSGDGPSGAGYHQPGPGYGPPGSADGPSRAGYPQPGPGYGPPPSGQPIMIQPTSDPQGAWMNIPQGNINCPPGLEYLSAIDQLLVHQKIELLEMLTGFETNNKYIIKNILGQKVYFAIEENDCLTRSCCGPLRPFEMKILDNYQNPVINLHRPLACDSCCYPCCLQTMEVSAPPGTIVGTIEQKWSILRPQFVIKNDAGDVVLRIEGPICTMNICCRDVEFKVLSPDGKTQVGKISKQWSGFLREAYTDADNFGITFPMDLDVKMKAVMLGACFLIDMMFFEKNN